jgi:aminopeptidase N
MLSDTVLRIPLGPSSDVTTPVSVTIDYRIELPPASTTGISGAHALAWSEIGDVLGYWHPVLAPYSVDEGWRVVPYHPVGDPILYEVADYSVTVDAPEDFEVIGCGRVVRSGNRWHFLATESRGVALIVTRQLEVSESQSSGRPVAVYHQAEHTAAAQAVLRAAEEALLLFEAAFGPYPYQELRIVEAKQFGGMEYSGLITFSSDWFAAYDQSEDGTFGADYLVRFVVHEIGHQWWYGGVGNDQALEPWLDESLARYGEWLYYSQLYPEHLSWWEAPSIAMPTLPIDETIYDFVGTDSYVQAVYVSGTRFILDLQARMGQDLFLAFLRDYYVMHRGQIVTGQDFLAALREAAVPNLDELLSIYFAGYPWHGADHGIPSKQ